MDTTPQPRIKPSVADYLAEERTFLAWIRTGLSLMGFGFVVARFGLFLEEFGLARHQITRQSHVFSLWSGIALILLGVVVNVYAARRHAQFGVNYESAELEFHRSAKRFAIAAILLALIGLAMAAYLALLHNSASAAATQTSTSQSDSANAKDSRMTPQTQTDHGIISKPSAHSVDETVAKLQSILESKGVTIFALVDHSGEAAKAGLTMPNTKLLIFGNPKGGTPVMLAAPTSAIDLPLKILVWQDAQGKVWVSYNSLPYLRERHGIPQDLLPNLAVVESLATAAAS